jgi:SEC-C motif-containing protein
MRSRFSAFAVGDRTYLLATWHPSTRPASLTLDEDRRWQRLEILDVVAGGPFDQSGVVEFDAHYRATHGPGRQHERSSFLRADGRWYYVGKDLG